MKRSNLCAAIIVAASSLVLTGCVTTTPEEPKKAVAKGAGDVSEDPRITQKDILDSTADFILSALPAQKLAPGDCGLFLFADQPTPRFVFFGQSAKDYGLIRHFGKEVPLKLISSGGDIFDQTYSEQSFEAPSEGLKVTLSLNGYTATRDGGRIPSGSLRLTDKEGWTTVTPVAGATTCNRDVAG